MIVGIVIQTSSIQCCYPHIISKKIVRKRAGLVDFGKFAKISPAGAVRQNLLHPVVAVAVKIVGSAGGVGESGEAVEVVVGVLPPPPSAYRARQTTIGVITKRLPAGQSYCRRMAGVVVLIRAHAGF